MVLVGRRVLFCDFQLVRSGKINGYKVFKGGWKVVVGTVGDQVRIRCGCGYIFYRGVSF